MHGGPLRFLLLVVGTLVGYALMMSTNPARSSLRDGLRCMARYPQVWLVPATFALTHSGFRLWRHLYETRVTPGAAPAFVPWSGWQPPTWNETIAVSGLPAMESTAAIFNCIVTTFPLSALVAVLFLSNWRGYQVSLHRGLRRRFGLFVGMGIHLCLIVSAVAAACKPMLFGGLPILNNYLGSKVLLRVGEGVDTLSFLFEYLLGLGVQIYIVLLCFAWIRGMTFDFDALRHFALRRFSSVIKWAAMVVVVSSTGISVPLIVSSFQPSDDAAGSAWAGVVIQTTRWLLSVSLLLFCSMQLLLIFHNESLRQAWGDHFRMLGRFGGHVGWLILIIALHFLLLAMADAFLPRALGPWTWPTATWSLLIHPLMWTALAAWFLASWVCLFRRLERSQPDTDELVRF